MTSLIRATLPLGVGTALVSLQVNAPRYVLEASLGAAALGIFSAIAYIQVAGSIVVRALGQALGPRLASAFKNGDLRAVYRPVVSILGGATGLGACAIAVAVLFGGPVLHVLYGETYSSYAHEFTIAMLGASLFYLWTGASYVLTGIRKIRSQLPMYITMVLVSVVGSWVLIPQYGMRGALWVAVLTNGVGVAISLALVAKAVMTVGRPGAARVSGRRRYPALGG